MHSQEPLPNENKGYLVTGSSESSWVEAKTLSLPNPHKLVTGCVLPLEREHSLEKDSWEILGKRFQCEQPALQAAMELSPGS